MAPSWSLYTIPSPNTQKPNHEWTQIDTNELKLFACIRAPFAVDFKLQTASMIPGEIFVEPGDIELNAGRTVIKIDIANTGDRPIQVGSHFHFYEVNDALKFDREQARGYRLNIAAGTAVRFEPGQERSVELVQIAGDRVIYGFNGKVMGAL